MMTDASRVDAQAMASFKGWVSRRFGLALRAEDDPYHARFIEERARATGLSASAWITSLDALPDHSTLADTLTVHETYFFRNADHFLALRERILPEAWAGARSEARPLRVLSAGCSTGEEAYSIVIALDDLGLGPGDARVHGVDLSPTVVAHARRARYSAWALRATPDEIRARYFARTGAEWALAPHLAARVDFRVGNLADPMDPLWSSEPFDVILCRNVLMYLGPEPMAATVARLKRSLRPGGFLLAGHAESLRSLRTGLVLCESHETFYYQRPAPHRGPSGEAPAGLTGWFEEIGRGEARIVALLAEERRTSSGPPRPTVSDPGDPAVEGAQDELAEVARLLADERLADARARLSALPASVSSGRRGRLLSAVLALHANDLSTVEAHCRALVVAAPEDASQADVHHMLARVHEQRGDLDGAIAHDQIAASLDEGFALARMHLGMVLRRAGDPIGASIPLREAAALMPAERPERIAWFGGGFPAGSLIAHCLGGGTPAGGDDG